MGLTAEQAAVVNGTEQRVVVAGAAGTGKTTALRARYVALAGTVGARRVLVVCHRRAAADRFRAAVLPDLAGGFDSLAVTTPWGVAFDGLSRQGQARRLLAGAAQRRLVDELLRAEVGDAALWPTLHGFVGRRAFSEVVAHALLDPPLDGSGPRWDEVRAFAIRYESQLDRLGATDPVRLLQSATAGPPSRFEHVLIDDVDAMPPAALALLRAHTAVTATVLAGNPLADLSGAMEGWSPNSTEELTHAFRRPRAPVALQCRHPSVEAEAIAGTLLTARAQGITWDEMAVIVRGHGNRSRAVARALVRHGIPVSAGPVEVAAEPAVQHLAASSDAHRAFEEDLRHLVLEPREPADPAADRALDAVVAYLDGVTSTDGAEPDPWVTPRPTPGAVTVATVAEAAGREWHTVVIAGAVEGELPRSHTTRPFFERAAPDPVSRRARHLAEERRRFATACSRATDTLVATVPLEAGVLPSRFVAGWDTEAPTLPFVADDDAAQPATTKARVPVWPDGVLRLSASQLEMYEDCPLRYAYRYALRARVEAGLHADLGSLVHEILERFLDPAADEPRTRERLFEIAAACWHDDIARYRPQREEARRDVEDMLSRWWDEEGGVGGGPDVLAVERHFEIAVGPHTVRGSIDRIDRVPDGIRVVDYKTGKAMPRAEAMADNLQLATYHLAATRDPEVAEWGRPVELRLLYLRKMMVREQPVAEDHVERTEQRVLAAAEAILDERFEPSVHADCDHCDYHRLCPLWPEGRHVGSGA